MADDQNKSGVKKPDIFDEYALSSGVRDQDSDLKTGAGMLENAQQQAQAHSSALPEPKPSFLSRAGETVGLTKGTDPATDFLAGASQFAEHPATELWKGVKGDVEGVARLPWQAVEHPLDTSEAILPVNKAIEDVKNKRYGAAAGDVVGGAVNIFGLKNGIEAAPDVAEGAASVLNKARIPSELHLPATPERAAQQLERAVAPSAKVVERGTLTSSKPGTVRGDINNASPYLADEFRGRAMSGVRENAGVEGSQRVGMAADRLWTEQIQPVEDKFAQVQGPGGTNMARAIRESYSDLDRTSRPNVVAAGESLADSYDHSMTVKEMSDILKELGEDKGVQGFYKKDSDAQLALIQADPSLEAKLVGMDALRQTLFDTIKKAGGETVSQNYQQARLGWGAMKGVQSDIGNARTAAPGSLPSGHSGRGFLLGAARRYFEDPNRLVGKGLATFGRTDLEPPKPTVDSQPFMSPANRLLNPAPTVTPPGAPWNGEATPGQETPTQQPARTAFPLAKVPGNEPTTVLPRSPRTLFSSPSTPAPQPGPARPLLLPGSKTEPALSSPSGRYRTAGVVRVNPNAEVAPLGMEHQVPAKDLKTHVAPPVEPRSFGPRGEIRQGDVSEAPKESPAQLRKEIQALSDRLDAMTKNIKGKQEK